MIMYISCGAKCSNLHKLCTVPGSGSRFRFLYRCIVVSLYRFLVVAGYESNLQVNANRKRQKYLDRIKEQDADYDQVKFVNLSLSTLGVFSRSSENFDGMLRSLKCDAKFCKYIKKKIVNMCIRTSYFIFCKRNKVWDNPKLMSI